MALYCLAWDAAGERITHKKIVKWNNYFFAITLFKKSSLLI
jgi:hypothetical protein